MKYIKFNNELLGHPIMDDIYVSNLEYSKSLSAVINYVLEIQVDGKIDLIHAHYGSFSSFGAYVVSGLTKIPYVVSSFGRDINIGYDCDHRIRWLIKKSFQDAGKIIIPEHSLKNRLKNILKDSYDLKNIVEIPMPIDTQILEKGDLVINETVPVLSTINSCFSPEKGIMTILNAFAYVLKKVPCTLLIAGQDDHPNNIHEKRLLKEVRRLNIGKHVKFLGYLSRNNVGELLNRSTLFIDARLKGNFSSVLLEAMLKEVPVIASQTNASKKVVENGYNGFVYPSGDTAKLREIIINCLNDKQSMINTKKNISEWNRKNISYFSEDRCFTSIIKTYDEVIKRSNLNGSGRLAKRHC